LSPSIGSFSFLETLNLGMNHIYGSMPSEVGLLTSLQILYLNRNRLSNTLPSEIGCVLQLVHFSALHNSIITGTLPSQIGALTNLVNLGLFSNSIYGPLTSFMKCCLKLRSLSLGDNMLTGKSPREVKAGEARGRGGDCNPSYFHYSTSHYIYRPPTRRFAFCCHILFLICFSL
jgi:hypothetical protein